MESSGEEFLRRDNDMKVIWGSLKNVTTLEFGPSQNFPRIDVTKHHRISETIRVRLVYYPTQGFTRYTSSKDIMQVTHLSLTTRLNTRIILELIRMIPIPMIHRIPIPLSPTPARFLNNTFVSGHDVGNQVLILNNLHGQTG